MSRKKAVRDNDASDHGGYIVASGGRFINRGIKVALDGDLHVCPIQGHGTTIVTSTSNASNVQGKRIVRDGDRAVCGAIMIASNATLKTA
jgi:uncharacterized Zn-binding protein involved in type VI secretion